MQGKRIGCLKFKVCYDTARAYNSLELSLFCIRPLFRFYFCPFVVTKTDFKFDAA